MADKYFTLNFDESKKILTGKVIIDSVDKVEVDEMYEILSNDLSQYTDYKHFILDVSPVNKVSSYALGIMMKSLGLVKKTKNYWVVVITDDLLQQIMLEHPELFDYLAVFPSLEDAQKFTE